MLFYYLIILNMQNNRIALKFTNENQIALLFEKCDIKKLLENYLFKYSEYIKVKSSSLYVLYGGKQLLGEELKKPISGLITFEDEKDKLMTLLVYQNTELNITDKDEIIIILLIESVKIVKLNGKKGEIIKNIIKRNFSLIKFDLKWCSFKYKEKEIDLNQTFGDIANDDDKRKLKIEIT